MPHAKTEVRTFPWGGILRVSFPDSDDWACDGVLIDQDAAATLIAQLQCGLREIHEDRRRRNDR